MVQGARCRAQGAGYRVQGSGSRVYEDKTQHVNLRKAGQERGPCSRDAGARVLGVQQLANHLRFRGGLVFKAHRLLYHSTLGLRVIKKKKKNRLIAATRNHHSK